MTEPTPVHGVLPRGGRPRQGAPLAAAVVMHLLIIGLALWQGQKLLAARPVAGDPLSRLARTGGGGGGGGDVVFILPPAPAAGRSSAPAERPATPAPIETPVTPPVTTVAQAAVATADASPAATDSATGTGAGPGAGGGTGGGAGGGAGPGTGAGSGPGSGTGEGGDATPPVLEAVAPHTSSPPKELRGRDVDVICVIEPSGRIQSVRFEPEIGNAKYREYLEDLVIKTYRFKPARNRNGVAVASVYTINLTLPTK